MLLLKLLMMKFLFSFILKLNSHHPYTFTSPLQQALKQNHCSSHNCYSVKNRLKLLAFKRVLNELLLETEWSEVMLIWWFVSIKLIRFFMKFSFLISLTWEIWKFLNETFELSIKTLCRKQEGETLPKWFVIYK